MAKYILTRLKGNMRSASDVAPGTGSLPVKVTEHRAITRIAWVYGTDLHYVEGKHSAVVALLSSWGHSTATHAQQIVGRARLGRVWQLDSSGDA